MYDFNEHRHNYAVWTAARAATRQMPGGSTANIKTAIEKSKIRDWVETVVDCTTNEFDKRHSIWASAMITALEEIGLKDISYGRVAKIIAIYLKSSLILCDKASSKVCNVIHPPIDSILLTNIAKQNKDLRYLKDIRWTQMTENKYWDLASKLRAQDKINFDWTIEEYWNPERE